MRFLKFKEDVLAVGLLAGTIIGAGVFSLPFVFRQVGFGAGIFYLFFFAAVYFITHWFYGEVAEAANKEGGRRHLFFYAMERYVGRWSRGFAFLMAVVQMVFVLTIYLVLSASFSYLIFGNGNFLPIIIFWLISSFFIFLKTRGLAVAELLATFCILGVVGIIAFWARDTAWEVKAFAGLNWQTFFLPFGPMLFSLAGRPAVDEMVTLTKKRLGRIIFLGTFIPAVVYLIFVWAALKANPLMPEDAVSGLGLMPAFFRIAIGILGLTTLWSSYIVIGANVHDILKFDLKFSKFLAGFSVVSIPLLLYLSGFTDFFSLVSFTGGIFLGLEGIFIVWMWIKMRKRIWWRWAALALLPVFLAAIGYEIAALI